MDCPVRSLRTKLCSIGTWARVVQNKYLVSYHRSGDSPGAEMQGETRRLQLELKKAEVEYALIEDDTLRASPHAYTIAEHIAKVRRQVRNVVWFEEDYFDNFERVRRLESELAAAKATVVMWEERNGQLEAALAKSQETVWRWASDNQALLGRIAELEAAAKSPDPPLPAFDEVAYLRVELRKYMLCVARDKLSPPNLVQLLQSGEADMQDRALHFLLAGAERAPRDIVETDQAVGSLLQVVCNDLDRAPAALQVLTLLAEANSAGFFQRVGNLCSLLRSICRDPAVRAAGLLYLAKLLRLLTAQLRHGVLQDKDQRRDLAMALFSLWKDVGTEGLAMHEVMNALANMTEVDPELFVRDKVVTRLVASLHATGDVSGAVLSALANLCKFKAVHKAVLRSNEFIHGLVRCIQLKEPHHAALRIVAADMLATLGASPETRDRVIQTSPWPALFLMSLRDDKEEYEAAMRLVRELVADTQFCKMVFILKEYMNILVSRVAESAVALSLLAVLLPAACTVLDSTSTEEKGVEMDGTAYIKGVMKLEDGSLCDAINGDLFAGNCSERRVDAAKVLYVLASIKSAESHAAPVFLAGSIAFLRTAKAGDELAWSVKAFGKLATSVCPKTLVAHPGLFHHLMRAMRMGSEEAGELAVALLEHDSAAVVVGLDRNIRMHLISIFIRNDCAAVRDCAAVALSFIYKAGKYDDRELLRNIPGVLKAIQEMHMHEGPLHGNCPNGAKQLMKYMRGK